jgi:hypothetical protein
MPTRQTSSLATFLSLFVLLSIFVWVISFVPTLKEGLRKVQSVINTFFQSPIMGLGVFLTLAGVYFSYYFVSAQSLDDVAQKFLSHFNTYWALFITMIAVAAGLNGLLY